MGAKQHITIYTIGHSVHPADEFIALLKHYNIALLADIRSLPGSRYAPQFNQENLEITLQKEGIAYIHIKELGGRRHTTNSSVNTGWRNSSFRGFADYMQTSSFKDGLEILLQLAARQLTCIMCAEAVPWRCHRSLVGDALLIKGIRVVDIFSAKKAEEHLLTGFAVVHGDNITYPAPKD